VLTGVRRDLNQRLAGQRGRATLPNRLYRVPIVISGPGIAGPTLGPRAFTFDKRQIHRR
jgi:hypothetical protein